jgi:hypothetical protein
VVFVSRPDGRFERTAVRVGRERDGEVEILAGLEPGTPFAARGALLLLNTIDLTK